MNTDYNELPLRVRMSGGKDACELVYGLAKQFYGTVADFARRQDLELYSNWRELPGGGVMFAQYGPAGQQLLEITMPISAGEESAGVDERKVSDTIPDHLRKGCDCEHVCIYAGELDYDSLTNITGKSGKSYKPVEGNYPKDYSLNVHCIPVEVPATHTRYAGKCRLYMDIGPTWGRGAMFFGVSKDEKDADEDRYLPVKIPNYCHQCYYWELTSDTADCDGTIYEGQDRPCGLGVSGIGVNEYAYRYYKKQTKASHKVRGVGEEASDEITEWTTDLTPDVSNIYQDMGMIPKPSVETELDQKSRERRKYRAYYDTECVTKKGHPDGTFVWYVPPQCSPMSRCIKEQKLRLYCAADDKLIQEVPITIIYNRPTWTFVIDCQKDELNYDYSYSYSLPDCPSSIVLLTCKQSGGGCDCKCVGECSATGTIKRYNRRGYIYAVDDEGTIAHVAMRPDMINESTIYCRGRPFGTDFGYSEGNTYWDESYYHFLAGAQDSFAKKWSQSGDVDWRRDYRELLTQDETYAPCYFNNWTSGTRTKKVMYDSTWPWNGGMYGPGTVFECGDSYDEGQFSSLSYFYISCFEGSSGMVRHIETEYTKTEVGYRGRGYMMATGSYEITGKKDGAVVSSYSTPLTYATMWTPGDAVYLGYQCSSNASINGGSGKSVGGVYNDVSIMGASVAANYEELLVAGKNWKADDTASDIPCE